MLEADAGAGYREHGRFQAVAVLATERVQPRSRSWKRPGCRRESSTSSSEAIEAGAALVEEPRVSMVSFTGSLEVGREIAAYCGRYNKRVHLEMGGKNAIIVLDDADVDLAIEGAVWSAFGTSGQRCTAASRMIVQERVASAFTDGLVGRAKALRAGEWPRGGDGGRASRQRAGAREGPAVHGDRAGRRRRYRLRRIAGHW